MLTENNISDQTINSNINSYIEKSGQIVKNDNLFNYYKKIIEDLKYTIDVLKSDKREIEEQKLKFEKDLNSLINVNISQNPLESDVTKTPDRIRTSRRSIKRQDTIYPPIDSTFENSNTNIFENVISLAQVLQRLAMYSDYKTVFLKLVKTIRYCKSF